MAWILNTKAEKCSSAGSIGLRFASSRDARRRAHRDEPVEEELDAEVRHRAAEEHRRHVAAHHRGAVEGRARALEQLDPVEEFAIRALVDQRANAFVVHARDRHRRALGAVLGALERVQLVRFAIVHAAEGFAAAERPVDRIGADAEHVLELVEQLERIARRAVHLVDEREERDAAGAADRKQFAGLRFYALGRVDQHDRTVGRQQRAVRVLAEILMARRVEEIDRPAVIGELKDRRRDRDAPLPFQFHPVGGRRAGSPARRDLTGRDDRSAVEQQLFGERGLAGVGVRDDRERPAILDFGA